MTPSHVAVCLAEETTNYRVYSGEFGGFPPCMTNTPSGIPEMRTLEWASRLVMKEVRRPVNDKHSVRWQGGCYVFSAHWSKEPKP